MRRTALVAAMSLLITLLPAPAQASPWTHVWMENTPAGLCLSIPHAGEGAVPTQETCVDVGNQLWTFEDTTVAGRYRLRNTGTGHCLAANGTFAVHQLICGVGTLQQWTLTGSGNSFRVMNVAVGKCIARQASGAIVLGSCTIFVAQWRLLF